MNLLERAWVVAESSPTGPANTTLELVSGARSLAKVVDVLTWGDGASIGTASTRLGAYGVARIYSVGDPSPCLPGPRVAGALAELIESGNVPDVVLVGATYDGRDVAGRLSAKLDRPTITNVVALSLAEGPGGETEARAEHAIFGGTQTASSRFDGPVPGIFVVRDRCFEATTVEATTVEATETGAEATTVEGSPAGGSPVEVVTLQVGDLGRTDAAQVVARHVEEQAGPKLDEATVVVSGGRGLGGAERYAMVEELASLLHGAAGASRAIVDAGWVPYSHQVGQTGKTVQPTVYIACGISGATQHMVGMKGAGHVIAINSDRDAPIFGISDLGVVGDCNAVLPRLIEAVRARAVRARAVRARGDSGRQG
ncbi:MAG: electron transfer flavoprotein subunit alpha/FixB family protein [Acidimicrobiales bacterium]